MSTQLVTATLATIPGREQEAETAVRSLLSQCDRINVVCNYPDGMPPDNLLRLAEKESNIRLAVSDNSWGDAAKFSFSMETDGYQLFCDDDLIYPDGYAANMVAACWRYSNKAAVSLAGSIIDGPVASYYNDRHPIGHCLAPLARDTPCNVLGTGVLAFHTDLMRIPLTNSTFPTANMADVHFAVICQWDQIPMVCIAHEALPYQLTMRGKPTIWDSQAEHDHIQAARCNEVKQWRIYAP